MIIQKARNILNQESIIKFTHQNGRAHANPLCQIKSGTISNNRIDIIAFFLPQAYARAVNKDLTQKWITFALLDQVKF